MTDREYLNGLRVRVRRIVGDMDKLLADSEAGDRNQAPHVAKENLLKVAAKAEVLINLRYAVDA